MPRQPMRLLLALIGIAQMVPAVGAAFCVRDADGALWVDCEEVRVGAVGTRIKCRREDHAELIFVEPRQRLDPGEGDCPVAASRSRGLGKDGIPRNGDEPPAEGAADD